MKNTITFDKKLSRWVLKTLGYKVTKAGIIVDEDGKWVPPLGDRGSMGVCGFVSIGDFAGVVNTKDGPRLVTKDIVSLIRLSDHLEEK